MKRIKLSLCLISVLALLFAGTIYFVQPGNAVTYLHKYSVQEVLNKVINSQADDSLDVTISGTSMVSVSGTPNVAITSTVGTYAGSGLFSAYNPTNESNYVFDENGSTNDDVGWVDVSAYSHKTVWLKIPTFGSTTIHFVIQGKVNGNIYEIYQKDYSASLANGEPFVVTETAEYIRVGLKVTSNGTDSLTVDYSVGRY